MAKQFDMRSPEITLWIESAEVEIDESRKVTIEGEYESATTWPYILRLHGVIGAGPQVHLHLSRAARNAIIKALTQKARK